ncbi:hypothetical protein EV421DRAFT_1734786 [Armillaria borealis]|uniref:MYND-type domain-containing protein n=1 Tax=Armillaria borealis TaxID=47425 RepID=A0AA39JLQ1_9AGAR|nr:hypothetical protein EV421DRAFT_1734786 [Armillaria borealis]
MSYNQVWPIKRVVDAISTHKMLVQDIPVLLNQSSRRLSRISLPVDAGDAHSNVLSVIDICKTLSCECERSPMHLTSPVRHLQRFWRIFRPWAEFALSQYIIGQAETPSDHTWHFIDPNGNATTVALSIVHLLGILSSSATVCHDMVGQSSFCVTCVKAWLIVLPHPAFVQELYEVVADLSEIDTNKIDAQVREIVPTVPSSVLNTFISEYPASICPSQQDLLDSIQKAVKIISLSDLDTVMKAHFDDFIVHIFGFLQGALIYLPVLRQVRRCLQAVEYLGSPHAHFSIAWAWSRLQDACTLYGSLYETRRANCWCSYSEVCTFRSVAPKYWSCCSSCGDVIYCSKQCQKAHWCSGHREDCKPQAENTPLSLKLKYHCFMKAVTTLELTKLQHLVKSQRYGFQGTIVFRWKEQDESRWNTDQSYMVEVLALGATFEINEGRKSKPKLSHIDWDIIWLIATHLATDKIQDTKWHTLATPFPDILQNVINICNGYIYQLWLGARVNSHTNPGAQTELGMLSVGTVMHRCGKARLSNTIRSQSVIIIKNDMPVRFYSNERRTKRKPVLPSGDVIVISSDEEEEPRTKKIKKLLKLEGEVKTLKKENIKAKQAQQKAEEQLARYEEEIQEIRMSKADCPTVDISELDHDVTCEILCGHIYCQECIETWFSKTLENHWHDNPGYRYGPVHTCPACRKPVMNCPAEVYKMKSIVRAVAAAQGESSLRRGANKRGDANLPGGPDPWDPYFLPALQST